MKQPTEDSAASGKIRGQTIGSHRRQGGGWQSGVSNAIQAKSNQIKRGPKILQEITERTFNRLFNSGKLFLHHSAPLFAPFAGAPVANQRLTIGNCTTPERQDYRPSFPSFAYVGNPPAPFRTTHHEPCVTSSNQPCDQTEK
jgi:hypothetical protein